MFWGEMFWSNAATLHAGGPVLTILLHPVLLLLLWVKISFFKIRLVKHRKNMSVEVSVRSNESTPQQEMVHKHPENEERFMGTIQTYLVVFWCLQDNRVFPTKSNCPSEALHPDVTSSAMYGPHFLFLRQSGLQTPFLL
ncbi:hypothetical protein XENOCAPTIV_011519 [Xenoophorus captivus]|uniref:Uncharacterized protein n=1 Tax=Xenoophorus captivus TaxID=1517983 RepID=A0ABV0RH82_9TELE